MDIKEVQQLIRDHCQAHGGMRQWAQIHKVSSQYVSSIVTGKRKPPAWVLDLVGLEFVQEYRQKSKGST
jgi:hypothetical protein